MFISKFIMQILPNIHLLAMFISVSTAVYRKKALIPLYIYIMIEGIAGGFASWWIPYLYVWLPMWAMAMFVTAIVEKYTLNIRTASLLYMLAAFIHGSMFGVLYAPAHAIMYGLSLKATMAWIIAGLPFDMIHGISNFFVSSLTVPISKILKKLNCS